jgi:hypothetical protein
MGKNSSVLTDMNVAHDRCGKANGCPIAYDHRGNDKVAMAAIVGKDSRTAANGCVIAYGDVLGVGDILRVDKGMTANLHAHGFEEPDAKGCQGYKGQEGKTYQVEQPVV